MARSSAADQLVSGVERSLPRHISPFKRIGRRGGGLGLGRLGHNIHPPRPSQVQLGRPLAQQTPPPPAAPPPPATERERPSFDQAPPEVAGGLGRRKPQTGETEAHREAMIRILKPENARWYNAQPADIQDLYARLWREDFRQHRTRHQNMTREDLREELRQKYANRPGSPGAERERARKERMRKAAEAAARGEGPDVGPAAADERAHEPAPKPPGHAQTAADIDAAMKDLRGE